MKQLQFSWWSCTGRIFRPDVDIISLTFIDLKLFPCTSRIRRHITCSAIIDVIACESVLDRLDKVTNYYWTRHTETLKSIRAVSAKCCRAVWGLPTNVIYTPCWSSAESHFNTKIIAGKLSGLFHRRQITFNNLKLLRLRLVDLLILFCTFAFIVKVNQSSNWRV